MANPDRAAARARVAELRPRGRKFPRWASWAEAAEAADLWLAKIQVQRGKRTMRVLENIVEEMLDRGKWLLDDRHAWQIAEETDVSSKWVLESLCSLERDGIAFRVRMAGLKSRHGLTSNVPVFPELLTYCLDLLPKGARAATIQFLRRSDVRAQLEAGGVWTRLPKAVTGAVSERRPSGITGTRVGGTALTTLPNHSTEPITDRYRDLDRSPLTPQRLRAVEKGEGGAVAPSPHIAPAATPAVPAAPSSAAPPPAAGERQNGPRPVLHSGRFRMAGSRSEVRATLPREVEARRSVQGRLNAEAVAAAVTAAIVAGDRTWLTLLRTWTDRDVGSELCCWIMSLRRLGFVAEEGVLVVRGTGPPDVLGRLVFQRPWMQQRASKALGVPVLVSLEGTT